MTKWLWRYCEECNEDMLIFNATRCKCGAKFSERLNQPPSWSKDGQLETAKESR